MTRIDGKRLPTVQETIHDQALLHAPSSAGLMSIPARIQALLEQPATLLRLNGETRRDIGLLPDEYPNAPLWGHGKIMWWP